MLGCSNDHKQGGSQNLFSVTFDMTHHSLTVEINLKNTHNGHIILCLTSTDLTSDGGVHGDDHCHGFSRMIPLVCGKHVLHGARELHSLLSRQRPPR